MTLSVGYLVGSTSSASINRKLVHGLVELSSELDGRPEDAFDFREVGLADLPLYNHDLDDRYPPEAVRLKAAIRSSDAILIATPEYNRSIPGALKNALDWASRPYGENAFAGKPVGIIGASVAAAGTAMAQQHLRNILAYLDAPTLAQPEAFIQYTDERFADDGTVRDPSTREFLTGWLTAYRDWARLVTSGRTPELTVSPV